jgi:hypothetical protein
MTIAIIGVGAVGGALARGLARAGRQLVLGVRDPADPKMQELAKKTGARLAAPAAAAASADIVILALPWAVAEEGVKALGDLSGKIVVDCMNPLAMVDGRLSLALGFSTSGGEQLAGWLPGARVVKTLNQVGAEMMDDNAALPTRPVMFMAGDDGAAKAVVADMLRALGFAPEDAGDLTMARLLEPYAMVWINQALLRGKGRRWAFAAVS